MTAQRRRVASLERAYELVKLGPRQEEIDAARRRWSRPRARWLMQADQLDNTIIRAPITGTILERAVEKGEFVTTSFVGDKGAKGYVVSLADLNDLEVELDINQNDFAKLRPGSKASSPPTPIPIASTMASSRRFRPKPTAQKATVQVKVKVIKPGRLSAAGDERQRGLSVGREDTAATPARQSRWSSCRLRRCGTTRCL